MVNILDNVSNLKRYQLIFLQRAIETLNSALTIRPLKTIELQKIISDISLEELDVEINDVKSLRENLIKFLEEGDEAVRYLMTKLDDYQARYFASSFLGWFGDRASIAIPKLINLASGHSSAAGAAQRAILFIGGAEQKILQVIKEALSDEDDESFRHLSSLAVKTDLNNSDVFFEVLRTGAVHESPNIREAAVDIIWQLKVPDREKIKSILVSLSSDEDKNVRDAALTALDSI